MCTVKSYFFLFFNRYSVVLDFLFNQTAQQHVHSILAFIQNLSQPLRKYPWALLPVTQLSTWFVTAPSDQNNCINKRRKALPVRPCWYHVRSLLNYNYETTNPLIVPLYGQRLDTCHCHMNTGWVISQGRFFTLLGSCSSKQENLLRNADMKWVHTMSETIRFVREGKWFLKQNHISVIPSLRLLILISD